MAGRDWYANARTVIKAVYGVDWKLMCGLLAATSPRSSVAANSALARKAYRQIKSNGSATQSGFIHTHYVGIQAVLKHGEPNGRKCKALYRNLIGLEDSVPVDIWMLRYAGIDKKVPSRRDYDYIEDRVKEEAKEMMMTPASRQAEIWCQIRGDSRGYGDYLRQFSLEGKDD